jgi:pyruvate dehydrogenase E2 component (dihydrolipoamide acetyltransferase)
MPTDVIMPQMGESIFEGTLTKWLKKPGEKVQRDEPLFEISTDKVDAEIPAPASGVLQEIKVAEGTTVQVNTVVGVIAGEGEAAGTTAPAPAKAEPARAAGEGEVAGAAAPAEAEPAKAAGEGEAAGAPAAAKAEPAKAAKAAEKPKAAPAEAPAAKKTAPVEAATAAKAPPAPFAAPSAVIEFPAADRDASGQRIRSSPLVRRIAKDNNVALGNVAGTGLGGRITKNDIAAFVAQHGGGAAAVARPAATAATAPAMAPAARVAAAPAAPAALPAPAAMPGEIVPMTAMRKMIAARMVESKHISAHVHTVFEVDMTRIAQLREREKAGFEQRTGSRLTFMPFFARAAVNAIQQFPTVNASVEGENLHYHREIHLGIAVALDWGLIVPVIKNAEERNFLGLQRAITDLGERSRTKKLMPDEVQGGTFTITNPGSFGALFGTPVIMQPQVAILGVGGIHKAAVVVSDPTTGADGIAVRSVVQLSLGFDHRVIDGAVADQFMALVKKYLENWNEELG